MLLFLFQVVTPYIIEKLHEVVVMKDWSNPDNIKPNASLKQRVKHILGDLIRIVYKLGKIAELINFVGLMANAKGFKRNLAETLLGV
jgi:hypothetical protein